MGSEYLRRTYIRTYEHAHFVEIQIVLSSRNAIAVDGTVAVDHLKYDHELVSVCKKTLRSLHQVDIRMLIFQMRLLGYKSKG